MHNPAIVDDPKQCLETRCPIQFVLEIVGSKWAILILRELFSGSRRTHEFLEALPGISTKTLTARLRELESYGLVTRKVYAEVPPRVEYSLTEKGLEIQPVMMALKGLGERWLQQASCDCPMDPNALFGAESLSA
ncbi:MAG: helix-turn-helix transcriptional regulator [Leptolyngbya sp. SIO1E4]|nr:helix-turn-helix transcriptional regulator [Leptolyngbya sp. SIO1E4]